jgi:DNA polymerase-1
MGGWCRTGRVPPNASMKIATFNINNVNKRLGNLLDWLGEARPDVVSLQELKAADGEFPAAAIEQAGYGAVWHGQKSWNGVAILARDAEPIVTRVGLPGDPADTQARYIEAAVRGVIVTSLYAPNGNPQPGPKFDYKLAWMRRLEAHARASRAMFRRLLDQGWTDAIRKLHLDSPMFTFWDYMRNRWPRDAGLRLDHLLLSRPAARRLVEAGVDRDVRGGVDASDHAPAWIVLREAAVRGGTTRRSSAPRKAKAARKAKAPVRPRTKKIQPKRPLLVIDGDSFAHRAYHALPKSIMRRGNKPAGAIVGFANMLLRFYEAEHPRAVLVAWDTLDEPTYRHTAFEAYQGGREFDHALLEQLDALPEFVAACGFANAKAAGYEADDFLASAAAAEERRKGTVLVASGDRDTFQLASGATTILYPVRAGEIARIGPAEVRVRYGVEPSQVPDFIALRGDPSDRLPGVPGVGPQGAAGILRTHGSLEAALKAGRFPALAEELRLYRSIATMDRKAPLPRLRDQRPTWAKASTLARDWQLTQLSERLAKLAARESA